MWDSLHTAMDKCFSVAKTVKNLPVMQETQVRSLGWKDPCRREWQPTPVSLPGVFHGQRSLAGYSLWGQEESNMTEWHCTTLQTSGVCLCAQSLSQNRLSVTPRAVVGQAPLPMGLPSRNTGVGCYFLLQGIFLARDQTCLASPASADEFFTICHLGSSR